MKKNALKITCHCGKKYIIPYRHIDNNVIQCFHGKALSGSYTSFIIAPMTVEIRKNWDLHSGLIAIHILDRERIDHCGYTIEKIVSPPEPTTNPNDLTETLKELSDYINATNSDKYANSPLHEMLGEQGKAINLFQVKKYLTRYQTEGFKKSNLRTDILKAIHYLLFELKRTNPNV